MVLRFLRHAEHGRDHTDVPQVAKTDRIYAVGDIHGRQDLLVKLLALIAEDAASFRDERQFRLIFLGDYIDRGDDAKGVLSTLTALANADNDNLTLLCGNHEAALLAFLDDPINGKSWLGFGAQQTLASYGVPVPKARPGREELLETRDALHEAIGAHHLLLRNLPTLVRSGDVIFTHAGLDPDAPLDAQMARHLVWGHPAFVTDDPVPGSRVVHGHYDDPSPVSRVGRICVDTGAYYTGRLTAVRLDGGEGFIHASA